MVIDSNTNFYYLELWHYYSNPFLAYHQDHLSLILIKYAEKVCLETIYLPGKTHLLPANYCPKFIYIVIMLADCG